MGSGQRPWCRVRGTTCGEQYGNWQRGEGTFIPPETLLASWHSVGREAWHECWSQRHHPHPRFPAGLSLGRLTTDDWPQQYES